MDQVVRYRSIVKDVLQEYARLYNLKPLGGQETWLITDELCDQFLLLTSGWSKGRRVRRIPLHVRLNDGKIWVEEDWTEEGIATALLQAGGAGPYRVGIPLAGQALADGVCRGVSLAEDGIERCQRH